MNNKSSFPAVFFINLDIWRFILCTSLASDKIQSLLKIVFWFISKLLPAFTIDSNI